MNGAAHLDWRVSGHVEIGLFRPRSIKDVLYRLREGIDSGGPPLENKSIETKYFILYKFKTRIFEQDAKYCYKFTIGMLDLYLLVKYLLNTFTNCVERRTTLILPISRCLKACDTLVKDAK